MWKSIQAFLFSLILEVEFAINKGSLKKEYVEF